jgi:L-2-hydroxycarboxylate dehydrogenase (NAD+)
MEIRKVQKLLGESASRFVTKEEAAYFAQEAVETHLKKSSPKYRNSISEIVGDIEKWDMSKVRKVKIAAELPSMIKINCNELPPSLKVKFVHDTLEKKAKATGIAIAAIVNCTPMHTMHFWTQGLAKRNLFGLASFNGGPLTTVPFNGTKGIMGTNPLTYAFPTEEDMVAVDFATSQIPYFEIMQAKKLHKKIPEGTAVDQKGNMTTDPNKAIDKDEITNLLPMGGGYKGYALNYLLEIMTGSMIGSHLANEMTGNWYHERGGFVMAINISAMNSLFSFRSSVSGFNSIIRKQKPKKGEKVIVPGDNNLERYAERRKHFEIDNDIVKRLNKLMR